MGDGVEHAEHEQRVPSAEYVALVDQPPERRPDLVIPVVPRGVQRHHDHLRRRQRRRRSLGRRHGPALRGAVGRPRRRGGGLVVPRANDGGHRHGRPERAAEGTPPPPPPLLPMQAPPAAAAAIVAARQRGYEGLETPTRRGVYSGDCSVHSIPAAGAGGISKAPGRNISPAPIAIGGSTEAEAANRGSLRLSRREVGGSAGGGSEKAEGI